MSRIENIPKVIIAACVLHNICLDSGDEFEDFMGDHVEEEINGFINVLPPGGGAEQKRTEIMERYC